MITQHGIELQIKPNLDKTGAVLTIAVRRKDEVKYSEVDLTSDELSKLTSEAIATNAVLPAWGVDGA